MLLLIIVTTYKSSDLLHFLRRSGNYATIGHELSSSLRISHIAILPALVKGWLGFEFHGFLPLSTWWWLLAKPPGLGTIKYHCSREAYCNDSLSSALSQSYLQCNGMFSTPDRMAASRDSVRFSSWEFECLTNNASFSSSSSVMAPYFQSCDPYTPKTTPCTLGDYIDYSINVSSVEDVVAGLNFAQENNIRLVIRNTGHE